MLQLLILLLLLLLLFGGGVSLVVVIHHRPHPRHCRQLIDASSNPFAAQFDVEMTPAMVARAREIEAAALLLEISNENDNDQLK